MIKEKIAGELRLFMPLDIEQFTFTPEVFKNNLPEKEWPVFKMQPIKGTSLIKLGMSDTAISGDLQAEEIISVLNDHLISVENWGNVKENYLDYMTPALQMVLYTELFSHSQLSEEETEGVKS